MIEHWNVIPTVGHGGLLGLRELPATAPAVGRAPSQSSFSVP